MLPSSHSDTELDKYSFEAELPGKQYGYVTTAGNFKPADFYIKKLEQWRKDKKPVRFVKSNGEGDDLSTLVLIESFDITEKSGEEGDYYVSFKLIEYKPFGKKEVFISTQKTAASNTAANTKPTQQKAKVSAPAREGEPPKPKTYTVASGDTLWGIAKKFLGDGAKYPTLVSINHPKIKNPGLIHVGQHSLRLASIPTWQKQHGSSMKLKRLPLALPELSVNTLVSSL